jgi:hypothetical protein
MLDPCKAEKQLMLGLWRHRCSPDTAGDTFFGVHETRVGPHARKKAPPGAEPRCGENQRQLGRYPRIYRSGQYNLPFGYGIALDHDLRCRPRWTLRRSWLSRRRILVCTGLRAGLRHQQRVEPGIDFG